MKGLGKQLQFPGKQLVLPPVNPNKPKWSEDEDEDEDEGQQQPMYQATEAQMAIPPPARPAFQPRPTGKGAALVAMKRPRQQYSSDEEGEDGRKPAAKRKQAYGGDDDDDEDDEEFSEAMQGGEDDEEEEESEEEESEEEESDDDDDMRRRKKPSRAKAGAKGRGAKKGAAAAERAPARARQQKQRVEEDEDDEDVNLPYKDQPDWRELKKLPELERESILAERHELAVQREQEERLRQKVKEKEKGKAKGKARAKRAPAKKKKVEEEVVGGEEADAEEEEEGELEEEQPKAGRARRAKLDDFVDEESEDEGDRAAKAKADGEKRGAQEEERERDGRRTTRQSTRQREDEDAMQADDDDMDMEEEAAAKKEPKGYDPDAPVASYEDMARLQLRRQGMEKMLFEPYFAAAVKGGFVRAHLDGTGGWGLRGYHYAEVVEVCRDRMYTFGQFKSDLYLKIVYGKDKLCGPTGIPIKIVSNHTVTREEHEAWVAKCREDRVRMPTEDDVAARLRRRERAVVEHHYTEQDITAQLEQRKKYRAGMNKKDMLRGLARRRKNLERELDAAQGDVDRLTRKLEQLRHEGSAEAQKEILASTEKLAMAQESVGSHKTELEKVMQLLEKENEKAFKAQDDWAALAEKGKKERQQRAMDDMGGGLGGLGNRNTEEADPFQRRRTAPKVLWSVKGKTEVKKEEGAGKASKASNKTGAPITLDKFGVPIPLAAQVEEPDPDEPPIDPLSMLNDPSLNKYMPRPASPKRRRKRKDDDKRRHGITFKEYLESAVANQEPMEEGEMEAQ